MRFSLTTLSEFVLFLSLPATSLSSSNSVPAGSKYLGCYVDSTDRIMSVWANGYNNNDPSMTNDFCAYECQGYNYFGTEAGSYCFCSNQLAAGAALASDPTTCDTSCAGNTEENCGGDWRLAVYSNSQTKSAPTTSVYRGCYVDSTDRIMSVWANGYNNDDPNMSNDFCAYECQGYNYFGTEAGSFCFCANQIATGAALASDPTTCDMACAGNKTENCGGSWRLAVYLISVTDSPGSAPSSTLMSSLTLAPSPSPSPSISLIPHTESTSTTFSAPALSSGSPYPTQDNGGVGHLSGGIIALISCVATIVTGIVAFVSCCCYRRTRQ